MAKTGDWAKARKIFANLSRTTTDAANASILQEGHYLRGKMVQGIADQAPGGKTFKPLSQLTLAARRLRGFRGEKALIQRGNLRNGITVLRHGGQTFVGVLKTTVDKTGKKLVDIAAIHEFGAGPIIIRVTPKMRRYLAVLYKKAGIPMASGGGGRGYVAIRIPARPFIRPVFERDANPRDVKKRLEERMANMLKKSWNL